MRASLSLVPHSLLHCSAILWCVWVGVNVWVWVWVWVGVCLPPDEYQTYLADTYKALSAQPVDGLMGELSLALRAALGLFVGDTPPKPPPPAQK